MTAPPAPGRGRRRAVLGGLAGAAVLVAVLTAAARAVGAVRVAVLGQTVGPTCLGDVYATANLVPNVVFEVVAGGALAGLVVPVLAGPLAAGDTATARRTASALLTWTVLLLAPLALLLALTSRIVVAALLGSPAEGCDAAAQVAVGARMLVVFAPQVVLYGVGIVLAGAAQASHRFVGPAIAPLLSSLVVIAAYLSHAAQAGRGARLDDLDLAAELTLSVGTTLGVAALSLPLLVPLRRAGIRVRPALAFPPGVARRVRALAAAGAAGLVAQQVSVVVVLRLLNDGRAQGGVVLFSLATTVFLVPWAVLAVPVATSAFPRLATSAGAGDEKAYAATLAGATRAVLLLAALGATALAVVAGPAARVLLLTAPGPARAEALGDALAAFAPGLVGYALVPLLTRALYARGAGRPAAVAVVAGWLLVVAADVALVAALPDDEAVTAVGLGNTVGMTAAGALLVLAVGRAAGRPALAGLGRTAAVAAVAAVVAGLAGTGVVAAAGPRGVAGSLLVTAAAAVVVLVAFAATAAVADRGLARDAAALLRPPRGGRGDTPATAPRAGTRDGEGGR